MKIADISSYQGTIDWNKARKELEFIIFRASVGMKPDKNYETYTKECGVPYAAYHYVKAGTAEEAEKEAAFFVECANKANPVFYIADIEYDAQTKDTTETVCVAFLNKLKELGCGRIGMYINTRYKWAGKAIGMCDIMWIPHWGKNDGNVPEDKYKPTYPHHLWQYTSKGTVSGIKGNVDLDQMVGVTLDWLIGSKEIKMEEVSTMSYDPKKVIEVALAEVGYLEKKTNSNLDDKTANAGDKNYTKYARDLDAMGFYNGRKNGVAWCDVFVDWCFVKAYGLEAAAKLTCQTPGKNNCGAGCKYSRNYYKNKKQLFDTPQPGDQIFFWPSDAIGGPAVQHTGLVYDVDDKYVYTVEGNTSGANGVVANGGGVCKKRYSLTYKRLAGFGRPNYGITVDTIYDPDDLKRGDKNDKVTELQKNLEALGYSVGKSGVDGDFGKDTEAAVVAFQKANNILSTGIVDFATRKAIADKIAPAEVPVVVPDPVPTPGVKMVVITGDSVNYRIGDAQKYGTMGHVNKGDRFEWVATSPATGWHAIRMEQRICWVSPKYSKVEVA